MILPWFCRTKPMHVDVYKLKLENGYCICPHGMHIEPSKIKVFQFKIIINWGAA